MRLAHAWSGREEERGEEKTCRGKGGEEGGWDTARIAKKRVEVLRREGRMERAKEKAGRQGGKEGSSLHDGGDGGKEYFQDFKEARRDGGWTARRRTGGEIREVGVSGQHLTVFKY